MNKKSGFIQLIVIVVILVIIALFLGKNPAQLWNEYVRPLFVFAGSLVLRLIEFIIHLVTSAWQKS